jgi:hypothetical protein
MLGAPGVVEHVNVYGTDAEHAETVPPAPILAFAEKANGVA